MAAAGARGEEVELDPPEMRRAIAWQLALEAIKGRETQEATRLLKAEAGCTAVRDVQVRACDASPPLEVSSLPVHYDGHLTAAQRQDASTMLRAPQNALCGPLNCQDLRSFQLPGVV